MFLQHPFQQQLLSIFALFACFVVLFIQIPYPVRHSAHSLTGKGLKTLNKLLIAPTAALSAKNNFAFLIN